MDSALRTRYLDVQRRRVPAFAAAERCEVVDGSGVFGWAAAAGSPPTGRIFVHAPVPTHRVAALLERFSPLIVTVLPPDPSGNGGWHSTVEALQRRADLRSVAEPVIGMLAAPEDVRCSPVPDGVAVRPVRRLPCDDPAGVALEDVAAACLTADPGLRTTFDVDRFVAHLRRSPEAVVLAAIDGSGRVRGTAGAALTGADATIYLVSTDPGWRGRGVASALTARAVTAAARRGATLVSLDASAQGMNLYLRLRFRAAVRARSWVRRPERSPRCTDTP